MLGYLIIFKFASTKHCNTGWKKIYIFFIDTNSEIHLRLSKERKVKKNVNIDHYYRLNAK